MAEPPQLYSPHVPVIVLKTSDCCTREPDNSGSLSGIFGEPRIIHILQLTQDQQWSYHKITTFETNIIHQSKAQKIYNLSYKTSSSTF